LGVAKYAEVPISKTNELNGNLSLSNWLTLFGRYEGVWISGYINDVETTFENILMMINGDEVTVKGIVDGQFFTTPIDYGGFATNIIHDFNDHTTKISISYRTDFEIEAGDNEIIDIGRYRELIP
jgi:hypothetical protein